MKYASAELSEDDVERCLYSISDHNRCESWLDLLDGLTVNPFSPYLFSLSPFSPLSFIHSSIHPYNQSIIHSFIHSFIYPFNHTINHPIIYPNIQTSPASSASAGTPWTRCCTHSRRGRGRASLTQSQVGTEMLRYTALFYSILFYSILFYSILF